MTDRTVPGPPNDSRGRRAQRPAGPRADRRTIRRRTSLPLQLYRFVAINLRMAKMVRRSHQG